MKLETSLIQTMSMGRMAALHSSATKLLNEVRRQMRRVSATYLTMTSQRCFRRPTGRPIEPQYQLVGEMTTHCLHQGNKDLGHQHRRSMEMKCICLAKVGKPSSDKSFR